MLFNNYHYYYIIRGIRDVLLIGEDLKKILGLGIYTFSTNIVSCLISLSEIINKFIVGPPNTMIR